MKTIITTIKRVIRISIIVLFFSCETDVSDDINLATFPAKLVINGGIERNTVSPLTAQQLRLTTTNNFLSNEPNPIVADADVSVTDGTNIWSYDHQGDGFYTNTALVPELGKTYTITILWNGETYQGSDTLNEVAGFDNFFAEFEEETIFSPGGYFLKFDSTDPVNIENYYYNRLFKNGEFVISPDPGNAQNLITSDEFFDGQQRVNVDVNGEISFEIGETATGQQLGISKEYFDYLFELFTQTGNTGISFGGNPPPATIRSNVINTTTPSNRAVGFFYAADVIENSIIITQ
ncbi:DUF4249 family protein [Aquimarina sp. MMG016]|uniref:DUF4249 family protein n=1 Tax=Aquimarina sp. MMG016 TaxID=2822690 RepID=UPI001B39D40A|nr:DUF4249 family protein [Aquimarina sp. MMG016]MBQ4820753.1 DUF4249 domain-containing protein [Aquimarina sp. MMG016]